MPARKVILAIVCALLILGGISATDTQFQRSGERIDIDNETFTTGGSEEAINLTQSNVANATYDEFVTVENASGARMVAGEDYQWNDSDGVLVVLAGGDLLNENNAEISYGFWLHPAQQQNTRDLWTSIWQVQAPAILVLGVAGILLAMRALAGVA